MADPSPGCDTSNTSSSKHSSGVALILLLFFFICGRTGCSVVVALMSMCVAKEGTFIVSTGRLIRRAGWWWRIWTGRQICGRIPLRATSRLLNIVPSLTVLVPLLHPAGRHWRRCTHGRGWPHGDRTLAIWLLLWVTLGRVTLTLRRVALTLWWVALTLWWILLMLWWWTASGGTLVVDRVRCAAIT